MSKQRHRITSYKVITSSGGVAKEFGVAPHDSAEVKAQVLAKAMEWAKEKISIFGELEVVEESVVLTRKYKPRKVHVPEAIHPMSSHVAHRNRNQFDIPPMSASDSDSTQDLVEDQDEDTTQYNQEPPSGVKARGLQILGNLTRLVRGAYEGSLRESPSPQSPQQLPPRYSSWTPADFGR